jgi:hypothetical protein
MIRPRPGPGSTPTRTPISSAVTSWRGATRWKGRTRQVDHFAPLCRDASRHRAGAIDQSDGARRSPPAVADPGILSRRLRAGTPHRPEQIAEPSAVSGLSKGRRNRMSGRRGETIRGRERGAQPGEVDPCPAGCGRCQELEVGDRGKTARRPLAAEQQQQLLSDPFARAFGQPRSQSSDPPCGLLIDVKPLVGRQESWPA